MSNKTKGILYHRGNEKELKKRSDWNELSHDERKQLGKLGWFETESLYPPDKYWDGEIENGVPHGYGTYYIPDSFHKLVQFYNGSKFVGTYKNGKRDEGTFTWISGNKYIGSYKDNKKWNGEMYYKEDDEIVRYENGEDITKKERVENYKKYKQEQRKKQK